MMVKQRSLTGFAFLRTKVTTESSPDFCFLCLYLGASQAMKLGTKMTILMHEDEDYCSINPPQDGSRILRLLSSALERWIRRSKILITMMQKMKLCDVLTVFDGSEVPGLSIQQYLERIYKYCNCTNSCFVLGYVYMDRFLTKTRTCLTYLNVHRLLITAVMLAAKFIDTQSDNNVHFAKVGGISRAEMNRLEIEFLFCVDFRLHVSPDLFRKYCAKLEEEEAKHLPNWEQFIQKFNILAKQKLWIFKNQSPSTASAIHYDDE